MECIKKLKTSLLGYSQERDCLGGGSRIRPEATGYGAVYFAQNMLETRAMSVAGKTAVISGSGNVAQYAAEKIIQLGGKVITLSDSSGFILDEEGITEEKLTFVQDLKNVKRGRIKEYVNAYPNAQFFEGKTPGVCLVI